MENTKKHVQNDAFFMRISIDAIRHGGLLTHLGGGNMPVLLTIARHAFKKGIQPNQRQISEYCGKDERSVRRTIKKLTETTYNGTPLLLSGKGEDNKKQVIYAIPTETGITFGESEGLFIKFAANTVDNGLLSEIGNDICVLLAIAIHIDEQGNASPSQETIAKLVGKSKTATRDAIDRLCKIERNGVRILTKTTTTTAKGEDFTRMKTSYRINPLLGIQYGGTGVKSFRKKAEAVTPTVPTEAESKEVEEVKSTPTATKETPKQATKQATKKGLPPWFGKKGEFLDDNDKPIERKPSMRSKQNDAMERTKSTSNFFLTDEEIAEIEAQEAKNKTKAV